MEKLKERLRHALLAFLLSVGLSMPLCGALDETLISPRILVMIAGIILLFEIAAIHKVSAFTAILIAAGGCAAWIFGGNGARILSDVGLAIGLRLKGIRTAIPLAAEAISITVTDSMNMIPWLLPALAATLTMLMTYRFDDTPVIRVLPWCAALTAAAFLLTGNGIADNPLKEKADEIRQAILDRLFFTEARDVFSLYSVGFSPQGADQLGGKPNPSETPVMQVSTPKTAYLRGTVYNRYTGHGWQNTTGGKQEVKKALRSVVWVKYKIKDKEVFDKAYSYIEQ